MSSCPSCANPVSAGARFCPTCGYALASATAEERRVVTVLFADFVGFTTLSEQLDPEQVKRLVDRAFQLLVDDITTFGGTVDKIVGDGIVALFGVPVAHEDDAERAVRAALRMQESLATFAATRVAAAGAETLQMRIGINTGVALVGTVAGTDHTAMGDVVNTASRLQTLAPPGGVLVGETTYGLTAASIQYEPIGELSARGREAPVPAWLAKSALAQPGARHRRRDVGIMGRSTELALAVATVDFSLANRQAALLAVDGEGGVGKSRLVDELVAKVRCNETAMVLEGSAVPYGEANVWWPIASALFDKLELEVGAPADAVRAVAFARGRELFPDGDEIALKQMADAFQHLLGYASKLDELDPVAARDAVARAVTLVLERRLRGGPVMLSITDVHWADPAVLALCEHLLVGLAHSPFVLVTTNRPDSDLLWPPLSTRAAVVRLPLEPLGPVAAAQLCRAIIGPDADEATINSIFERSGGNPLFLEELAVLVAEGGNVTTLPDSLRAVIAARLDQLPPDQRAALDNAAVLGPSGLMSGLTKFAEALGQRFDVAAIEALADSGLLAVDGRRWSFKSDSVREVAYNTLTKAVRAQRHVGIAKSMEHRQAPIDDIAHHLAAAAELVAELGPVDGVPDDIRDEAVTGLGLALQRAIEQGNLRQILRYSTRAIDLLGDGPLEDAHRSQLAHLRLRRVGALIEMRHLDRARAETDAVLAEAVATDDESVEAGARRAQGQISQAAGDLPAARRQLGEAVDLFREIDDRPQLAETLRLRGFLELFGGSLADAEWLLGEAAGIFEDLGDRRGLGYIEQHRAWMAFLGGNLVLAEELLHKAAGTLNELGDRAGVGWAFGLLAYVQFMGRKFAEAEDLATLVRSEAKERGDEWAEAMMMSLLASIRLWTGRHDAAAGLADLARIKFKKLGDGFGMAQALSVLGRTQVANGDPAAARTSEALVSQPDVFGQSPYPYLAAAGIAMHGGDGRTAVSYADEAIALLELMRANPSETWAVRAIGMCQIGRIEEARISVDHISGDAAESPFAQSAGALVAVLEGRHAEAVSAAERVIAAAGHSYLDGVIACVAAGAASVATGGLPQPGVASATESATEPTTKSMAESLAWLNDAVARAHATQDIVARALALGAFEHIVGHPHEEGAADLAALGYGWRAVIAALPKPTISASGR